MSLDIEARARKNRYCKLVMVRGLRWVVLNWSPVQMILPLLANDFEGQGLDTTELAIQIFVFEQFGPPMSEWRHNMSFKSPYLYCPVITWKLGTAHHYKPKSSTMNHAGGSSVGFPEPCIGLTLGKYISTGKWYV